jgi:AraC-like DNA-binding protein
MWSRALDFISSVDTLKSLAFLFIGFSVFYTLVLIASYFKKAHAYNKYSAYFGSLLVLALALLQLFHFLYLRQLFIISESMTYQVLLFIVAPVFYYYAKTILKPVEKLNLINILHLSPILLIFVFDRSIVFSLVFVIGGCYLLWLLVIVFHLRAYREQFKTEVALLLFVFLIAAIVAVFAIIKPFTQEVFFSLYSISIGVAFLMTSLLIHISPEITESISIVVSEAYNKSTLNNIDCDEKLEQLESVMDKQKLFQQSNLDLFTTASEVGLSPHQLSELVNTKLGKGFSRYLREKRVSSAQKLLKQNDLSVLSIGFESGFSTQSNFYSAFKEITGTTPAKYRKTIK